MEVDRRATQPGGLGALAALAAAVLALSCATGASQDAAPLMAVGDSLESFSLEDQHGEAHSVDAATRWILYSRDMDAGDVIKQVLAAQGTDFLSSRSAVYIADISRMPRLISRTIAIPRMRDRSYATLLDVDGSLTSRFPSRRGDATILRIDRLTIAEIYHTSSPQELREIFGK